MAVGQSGEKDAYLAGSADGMLLEICLWADNSWRRILEYPGFLTGKWASNIALTFRNEMHGQHVK